MEDNFPNNSHTKKEGPAAPKPGEKKITPVVQGQVTQRKKPLGRRFSEFFFQGNPRKAAGEVFVDSLLPAGKDMVIDGAMGLLEGILYGEARGNRRPRGGIIQPGIMGAFTSYRGIQNQQVPPWQQQAPGPQKAPASMRSRHDFQQMVFASRVEADEVLDQMYSVLAQYEVVTVSDLYEMCNISPHYTDEKWGWMDLSGSNVQRVSNGQYVLNLPKTVALKD
jgi:hypothetical protein